MAEHGTTSRYRHGCRCWECRQVHTDDTIEWRRGRLYGPDGPVSPTVRARIIAAVRHGATVGQAATGVGLSHQRVYAAVRALPEFGAELAAAERVGRRRE